LPIRTVGPPPPPPHRSALCAAEVEQHWEEHGEELKPSPECPDPDPIPDLDDPEPTPTGPSAEDPTTVATAQQLYDPNDDPLILVEQQSDGTYRSVTISVLDEAHVPPAAIRTAEQYEQWLAEQPRAD